MHRPTCCSDGIRNGWRRLRSRARVLGQAPSLDPLEQLPDTSNPAGPPRWPLHNGEPGSGVAALDVDVLPHLHEAFEHQGSIAGARIPHVMLGAFLPELLPPTYAFLPELLLPTYALHPKGANQAVAIEVSVHNSPKSLLAGTQSDCPMRIPRVNWSDLGVLKGLLGMNLRCCLCHRASQGATGQIWGS